VIGCVLPVHSDGSVYMFDTMNPPRMGNTGFTPTCLEDGPPSLSSSSLMLHQAVLCIPD
jgi:hypothetical protein